jgi:hypothetical protein
MSVHSILPALLTRAVGAAFEAQASGTLGTESA